MSNFNLNGESVGNEEKDDVEPQSVHSTCQPHLGALLMECKRGGFVQSSVENQWTCHKPVYQGADVSLKGQSGNVVSLYPRMAFYDDECSILSSNANANSGQGTNLQRSFGSGVQDNNRVIDFPNGPRKVERFLGFPQNAGKHDVIVAAASSSSIGDLNIQELPEIRVQKSTGLGERAEFRNEPLLSLTVTETTSEDFVSSTTGNEQNSTQIGIFEVVKRTAFTGEFQGSEYETPFIPTGFSPCEDDSILGTSITMEENILGDEFWDNCPDSAESTQNASEGIGEVPGDDEDIGDDDSAGLILKDETDTAEEGTQSGDEMTDSSASETEDQQNQKENSVLKPVITISDTYLPRLVIDFGEEMGQTKVFEVVNTLISSPSSTIQSPSDGRIHDSGNGNQFGKNNNVLHSHYVPVQNWVEYAQQYNKQKRTKWEGLEDCQ